jgi:hypothetical protein
VNSTFGQVSAFEECRRAQKIHRVTAFSNPEMSLKSRISSNAVRA